MFLCFWPTLRSNPFLFTIKVKTVAKSSKDVLLGRGL